MKTASVDFRTDAKIVGIRSRNKVVQELRRLTRKDVSGRDLIGVKYALFALEHPEQLRHATLKNCIEFCVGTEGPLARELLVEAAIHLSFSVKGTTVESDADLIKAVKRLSATKAILVDSELFRRLIALAEAGAAVKPTHIYDPENWEVTCGIGDPDLLWKDADGNGPFRTAVLAALPDKWAVRDIPGLGFDLFDTEAEAVAAVAKLEAKDGDGN